MVSVREQVLGAKYKKTRKVHIPKEELAKKYETLTIEQLAKEYSCSMNTIQRRLIEYDIRIRTVEEWMRRNKHAAGEKNARWRGGSSQYWKKALIEERGSSTPH
jgi:intergrase/recombinase